MLVDNLRMLDAYVGTYGCAGCLFTLDGLRISAQHDHEYGQGNDYKRLPVTGISTLSPGPPASGSLTCASSVSSVGVVGVVGVVG
ncbi:hypothetical protein GSD1FS_0822 [Bifidobacterium sp. GSD1FS]|uniref:Uncharacterized protein n=1 Tax=Bifidobacterium canis TaxID=2610880 RepID=A0A7K1J4B4_9BIFI|nr:hypothetical protein [Bifidobacterium canis]